MGNDNMSNKVNQGQVTYNSKTDEVIVRRKSGRSLRAPFSAIAPFSNKTRNKSMDIDCHDLLDRLTRVSKGAFIVFNNLKYHRDERYNITRFKSVEEMTKTDREVLSRRLKELKEQGLIRRVKRVIKNEGHQTYTFREPRSTYIINPELLRPLDHDETEYLWKECE